MKKSEKLKKLTDARAYKLLMTIDQDPYHEEYWSTHHRRTFKSQQGSKNIFCWKRKTIYQFQYRMYRNWKYNRKTKYKL